MLDNVAKELYCSWIMELQSLQCIKAKDAVDQALVGKGGNNGKVELIIMITIIMIRIIIMIVMIMITIMIMIIMMIKIIIMIIIIIIIITARLNL